MTRCSLSIRSGCKKPEGVEGCEDCPYEVGNRPPTLEEQLREKAATQQITRATQASVAGLHVDVSEFSGLSGPLLEEWLLKLTASFNHLLSRVADLEERIKVIEQENGVWHK